MLLKNLVLVFKRKETQMKFRMIVFGAILLAAPFFVAIPQTAAQSPGQLRAMKQRAAKVTLMKNKYVTRVLESNNIPYQLISDGIVGRLKIEGKGVDVSRIEIVPVANEDGNDFQVTGHELFFYTKDQILHLVSSLIIR